MMMPTALARMPASTLLRDGHLPGPALTSTGRHVKNLAGANAAAVSLTEPVETALASVTADTAYDTRGSYKAAGARGVGVIRSPSTPPERPGQEPPVIRGRRDRFCYPLVARMILEFNELKNIQGKVAMIDGAFDPLHHGHVAYFHRARELATSLLCNLAPDSYVLTKHPLLLPAAQRALVIDALADIDYTHVSYTKTETVLRALRPTQFIKGKTGRAVFQSRRCGHAPNWASSLCSWTPCSIPRRNACDATSPRCPAPIETSTRSSDWWPVNIPSTKRPRSWADCLVVSGPGRLETLPDIGYQQVAALREVFQPERVVNVACMPGDVPVRAPADGHDGAGVRTDSPQPVPSHANTRIEVDKIADDVSRPTDAVDLVICRDVLERLTILQIRETVRYLCRLSARYVYVDARFHPMPARLLDVDTTIESEMSSFTLLNQDFLRLLFVLEGFQRRTELERSLDRAARGGVLVSERPNASV